MNKTVIDSRGARFFATIKELVEYKDLFVTMAYRDLRVRYAQTFLGLLWAALRPLTTLVVLVVVFEVIAKMKTDVEGVPYTLFVLCGMTSWTYFSFVLSESSLAIKNSGEMIKKIYFPRLILPLSKAVVGLVDYAVVLVMLTIAIIYSGIEIDGNIVYLPVFILMTIISALAAGIWLSALTVKYRDFQQIVPFLVQFGLYASPVAYPASKLVDNPQFPEWAKVLYFLNPMAGVSEGIRWCLLGSAPPNYLSFISFGVIFVLFISGIWYFNKIEKTAADIV